MTTTHICALLDEARVLAERAVVIGADDSQRDVAVGLLERAANLAEHAACELIDESYTSKGWKFI